MDGINGGKKILIKYVGDVSFFGQFLDSYRQQQYSVFPLETSATCLNEKSINETFCKIWL